MEPRGASQRYTLESMIGTTADIGDEAKRREIRALVDRYRTRCLWFLRADYYPATDAEVCRVLAYLERYGDRDAFIRAADLRRWLSPPFSDASVGS